MTERTVLITGGARRVGKIFALAAARAGFNVVLHYNASLQSAQDTAHEIETLGRRAFLLQADLSQPDEAASLMERAIEISPLCALVNNAAIFDDLTWDQTTYPDWQRHLEINLTAPFLLSQSFARFHHPGQTGRIINILDWRALRPGGDHLPYTISKAGLAALTRSLATALAPQILVNAIALGAILPPSDGGETESVIKNVPASRWAEVDEVSDTLIFLLTGPAYITGEIIHLDGGRHLI